MISARVVLNEPIYLLSKDSKLYKVDVSMFDINLEEDYFIISISDKHVSLLSLEEKHLKVPYHVDGTVIPTSIGLLIEDEEALSYIIKTYNIHQSSIINFDILDSLICRKDA